MSFDMLVPAPEPAAGCTRAFSPTDGMGTTSTRLSDRANTMSSVLEVLGLSLPYSSSTPATFDGTL